STVELVAFSFLWFGAHRALHSFPTRRSSDLWLDILAKILRKPVHTVTAPDTGNLGNSLMAGKALGLYSSYVEASQRMVSADQVRSEEHTSELQSRENLVCRLLLEKKKRKNQT